MPEKAAAGFGALLFVVALLPRLWAALALAGEPVWDGHYYDWRSSHRRRLLRRPPSAGPLAPGDIPVYSAFWLFFTGCGRQPP